MPSSLRMPTGGMTHAVVRRGGGEGAGGAECANAEFMHRFPDVGFIVCFADHLITFTI